MSDGFQFLDIIFFAAIAAFILLRLRNTLGRRTGHERPRHTTFPRQPAEEDAGDNNVIPLPDRADEAKAARDDDFADVEDKTLAAGLTQIKVADPGFSRGGFLEGARAAFEMVVEAYAAGDVDTLRRLLDDDVYRYFVRAIREREENGQTLETVLVSIDESEIIEAGMKGRVAFVTVRFVSEQINVTRGADGEVVDGDPSHPYTVTDIWSFERDTRTRDPNWKLVATRSPN